MDLGNTGDILDLCHRLLHKRIALQRHHKTVAQVGGQNAGKGGTLILMIGNECLQRFLTGNELGQQHIVDLVDSGSDAPGVGVRQVAVHINQNFICLIQILHHQVHIVNQSGEAAHNQQAGHRDNDGGKGHEAVGENATDALHEQISDIIDLHSCNTHPFRR